MTEVAAQMPRGFNIDMKVLVDQQLKFLIKFDSWKQLRRRRAYRYVSHDCHAVVKNIGSIATFGTTGQDAYRRQCPTWG
jgi:hypothetical protein